jgi:hypothetical protein
VADEAVDPIVAGRLLTELQGMAELVRSSSPGRIKRLFRAAVGIARVSDDGSGETSAGRKSSLERQLKGDLHMHTDWSDGSATVTRWPRRPASGYDYIGITDHTKGLKIVEADESHDAQERKFARSINC